MTKRQLEPAKSRRLDHIGVRLNQGEVAKLEEIRLALQGLSPPGMPTVTPSVALRWALNQAQVPG